MFKLDPTPLPSLLGETHQEIKWIWEPFIPEGGLVVCSAYMKVGKSTLVYALLKCIARGERFVNYPTSKTNILLLAVEEHRRDVAKRLSRFGLDQSDANVFVHAAPLKPSVEVYNDLVKFIQDNKIGLLVVDTLSEYWGIEDENDNAMVQKLLSPLLAIARKLNVAVLLIHHNSKAEVEGAKGIRGASAIFGIVDQAIMLKFYGNKNTNQRKIETFGRYDETPKELVVALTDDDQYLLVGTVGDAKIELIRERIKEFLAQSGVSHSAPDLAQALEVSLRKIHKAMTPTPGWCLRSGSGVKGDPYSYSFQTNAPVQPSLPVVDVAGE